MPDDGEPHDGATPPPDEPHRAEPGEQSEQTEQFEQTEQIGPDLTKRLPTGPDTAASPSSAPPSGSPYEAPSPWSGPVSQQPPPAAEQGPPPGQQHGSAPEYGSPRPDGAPPPYGAPQPYAQPYGAPPQYGAPQPYAQPYGAPQQYGAPQGYGLPYGQPVPYGPAGPTTSGKATTVLVLGIASLVLLFMCGIGLVTSIVALAMAPGAKREIEASEGRLTGLGMVQGGKICSWITIGLVLLFVAVWILLLVVGASIGSDNPYSDI